ncbi:polymorphic toxin-type HINT domain-containing protein [Kitasatospora sp. NPDC059646]|uniref:polymorphic toxin-type HINT domain-containing protein n=1 Tax=Kitasatospora sp. NPDC059646 TaxID=3346893 RepID=UPI00367AA0D0
MRITSSQRIPWRHGAVGMMVGGLLAGLLATPAFADDAPPVGPVADRVTAVAVWKNGGPAVKRAAEIALAGNDSDVHTFVTSGRQTAADADPRTRVEELVAVAGPEVRKAATKALAGTAADLQAFLDTGYKTPFADDQQILATQIMAAGGPEVRKAANKAFNGTLEDVNAFLATGQYTARDDDDQIKATQLMATGGPVVRAAANTAMNGGIEDVREFLRYGYQTAAAHDAETLTISQLADLTSNAAGQAGEQAKTAQDAAAKALASSALAKQAAETAAAETKAAQGDAKKASNAAGKAADAAERAAKAAQTASAAAASANEAARQAAAAAADAARASTLAGNAAALAQSAAAAASSNKDDAAKARDAAVIAKKASADAKTAGEAAAWAIRASSQADLATTAAKQAGDNADIAALASLDAAEQAGVSDEAKDRARAAANRAKNAAAEARRASAQVQKIAADAKAAATEAQRASEASAGHAAAAATAAEQAAAHAGDAATAAATAQAAATAAQSAADNAANAATQAHKVADIARASDTERLAAQQAAEVAAAQQAYFDEAAKTKQAAWEAGKASKLSTDTQKLLTEATAPGVDQAIAVAKGRQAAIRLLTAGGPWVQVAAQTALGGHDADVQRFLTTDLEEAKLRDDRASVIALANASTKLPQRLAAEAASVGTAEQVRDFLANGTYPGKDDDDQILATQIMAAGGPQVRKAANAAMNGTIEDIRAFIATGQYIARNDDNDILITQAMATGGPEVHAAAQAVLSGPDSGFEPFLQAGLPKARQRDAATAAHVATIASYLQAIDGNVAKARQSAAQAAQSYAIARGAANEAATYAGQAQASATEAANWAAQAAESARQAKASADQASGYAAQARASAARADAAARSADYSAVVAAGSAEQTHKYAADAQKAATEARDSAIKAGQSAAEAQRAATEAFLAAYKRMQDAGTAGEMEARTTTVDEDGRVAFVQSIPRGEMKYKRISDNSEKRCNFGYNLLQAQPPYIEGPDGKPFGPWRKDASGAVVCDYQATIQVTGTVDQYLRTCPEANLTMAECQGKYRSWDLLFLRTDVIKDKEIPDVTLQVKWEDWRKSHTTNGMVDAMIDHWADGLGKCNTWGWNSDCAWSLSLFLPVGELLTAGKEVLAYRLALEIDAEIPSARAAVEAALGKAGAGTLGRLDIATKAITDVRTALNEGKSPQEALNTLKSVRDVDPMLVPLAETEIELATAAGQACKWNSFPAGTPVVLADGSRRPIEEIRVGDRVLASDPTEGTTQAAAVTATFSHDADRLVDLGTDDGGSISTTAGHRFYIEAAGWKLASELHEGDRLRSSDNTTRTITSVNDRAGLGRPVYDLTVDGLHTFYVGTAGGAERDLLVHNCVDIIADEGLKTTFGPPHTLAEHTLGSPTGLSPAALLDKVRRDGIASIWTDAATAARAVDKAFAQWMSNPTNRAKFSKFLNKQRPRVNPPFDPKRDQIDISWVLRDEGSLGTEYTKNPKAGQPGEPDLISKATGNTVVITIRFAKNHDPQYVVFTSHPE